LVGIDTVHFPLSNLGKSSPAPSIGEAMMSAHDGSVWQAPLSDRDECKLKSVISSKARNLSHSEHGAKNRTEPLLFSHANEMFCASTANTLSLRRVIRRGDTAMKNNLTKQKNSRALLAAPALSGFSTRSVPPPMLNEARSFFVKSEVIHRLTIILKNARKFSI
jgi:hypothetical protein